MISSPSLVHGDVGNVLLHLLTGGISAGRKAVYAQGAKLWGSHTSTPVLSSVMLTPGTGKTRQALTYSELEGACLCGTGTVEHSLDEKGWQS